MQKGIEEHMEKKKKNQENTFFMIDFPKGSHISESVRIAPKGLQRSVLEFEEGDRMWQQTH